ncbi:hypothetical protein M407DRAFT_240585 [Tulasnella calospora MUT 4182]|uniref:Uncharacterized protein n=1 Tax=Tulasnella calospora MUT 4182 TaxID=1051891 RepID=A0A0C3LL18_9AGAM|nr:hypothetical protein M407DRAFT_240585 [Tulasnella calospora MUT 4182]
MLGSKSGPAAEWPFSSSGEGPADAWIRSPALELLSNHVGSSLHVEPCGHTTVGNENGGTN